MGIVRPGKRYCTSEKDGNEPRRSYIRGSRLAGKWNLGGNPVVWQERAWLTRDEVIIHFYPLKRNLVASNRPSPSLGATFLLRYEFVKSDKG